MNKIFWGTLIIIVAVCSFLALSCGKASLNTDTTAANNTFTSPPTTPDNSTNKTGVAEGKVWIGPLGAGFPEKPDEPYPTEIYEPRNIMVYDAIHNQLIRQVDITEKGYYSVELPAATYIFDINYIGSDWSNDVPKKLTVISGLHMMNDFGINTGELLKVDPRPNNYLFNSLNQSSQVLLKTIQVNTNVKSSQQYMPPWSIPTKINIGDRIVEVRGTILNNHPQNKEIAMYAQGFDKEGNQVSWTLDAAHIIGQIGLHLEKDEVGKFTLHLNYTDNLRVIRIFANNYAQDPP